MTTETTQSNGVTVLAVNLHDPFGESKTTQEAQTDQDVNATEPQDGSDDTEQETLETSTKEEQELDPIAKAKAGTPKGVQKRLDQLTKQANDWQRIAEQATAALAAARQNADFESDVITSQEEPKRRDGKPTPDQFKSDLEYVEALTDWKVEQALQQRLQREAEQAQRKALDAAERAAQAKYDDYQEGIEAFSRDSALVNNPMVIDVLRDSPIGPEIAYYLGKNPDVRASLEGLPAHRVAAKLGAIEESLQGKTEAKPAKPKASLPKPPAHEAGMKAADTTWQDPNVIDVKRNVELTRQRYLAQGLKPPY